MRIIHLQSFYQCIETPDAQSITLTPIITHDYNDISQKH